MATEQNITSFDSTPEGRQRLWTKEFAAAKEWHRDWKDRAGSAVAAYLDEREAKENDATHLTFFWANTTTLFGLLYGRVPRVSVSRRHADPNDDLVRVGALMLERLLNTDIERYNDTFRDVMGYVLFDRLVPGYGNARVRYCADFEDVQMPERGQQGTPTYAAAASKRQKKPGTEEATTDYFYWSDQLWSPCRTHAEKRWHAFMAPMTREDLHQRFDRVLQPDAVDKIPLTGKLLGRESDSTKTESKEDPWGRAEVWEIWDKQKHEVVWFVEGYARVLDVQPDPLGLDGFWPCPRPLMSNVTTREHRPKADYDLVRDLYEDVNLLATRITDLEDALRVAGAYDENVTGLKRLLDENVRNQLVPVKGFANISEKGGLDHVIAWLPMDQVAATLDKTKEQLADKMRILYELTGWSDVMRGQMEDPQQLATNTRAVTRFTSARIQAVQDEVARYASDLQRLRAEIIIKFFDDETVLRRSNILETPDKDMAVPALRKLRDEFTKYVIEVKPENLALSDFAAMKAERTEFLQAFVQMLQAGGQLAAALGPANPAMTSLLPTIIEVVKWVSAGYRGASNIEGVLDKLAAQAQQMAQQAQQNPQPAPQDPKLATVQAKAQADMARMQAQLVAEQQRQQIKTQGEAERQQIQTEANVQQTMMEAEVKAKAMQDKAAADAASRGGQKFGGV